MPSSSSAISAVTQVVTGNGPGSNASRSTRGSSAGNTNNAAARRSNINWPTAPKTRPSNTVSKTACRAASASEAGNHATDPQTTPCSAMTARNRVNPSGRVGAAPDRANPARDIHNRQPMTPANASDQPTSCAMTSPRPWPPIGAMASAHTSNIPTSAAAPADDQPVAAWARSRDWRRSAPTLTPLSALSALSR